MEITRFKKDEISVAEKKLEYLRFQIDRVSKAAERLYKQKIRNYGQKYLNATINFKKIELAANRWELDHYNKHYNRFPDSQYFLTNPNIKGITEYVLLNKNIKVIGNIFENKHFQDSFLF